MPPSLSIFFSSHNLLVIALVLVVVFIVATIIFKVPRKSRSAIRKPDRFDELHAKIKEEIKFAVAPHFIEVSLGVNDLIDLAIEVWRIEQRLGKSSAMLPEPQKKGLENSVQKLKRYLEKYDIEIVDYTNKKFNDGLNLDILSVEKDPAISSPTVKETIEPTVMCKGQVVRRAKIILLTN